MQYKGLVWSLLINILNKQAIIQNSDNPIFWYMYAWLAEELAHPGLVTWYEQLSMDGNSIVDMLDMMRFFEKWDKHSFL